MRDTTGLDWYIDACRREVAEHGFDADSEFLPYIPSDELRFKMWRARAIMTALQALSRGTVRDLVTAMRVYGLAREYHGRLNAAANVRISDALSKLAEELADRLRDGRLFSEVA